MQAFAKRAWNQPLSKKASRVFVLVLVIGVIAFDAWLGRNRLFAHDHRYQVAFLLFVGSAFILVSLLLTFGEKARRNEYAGDIHATQIKLGIISFLTVALFGMFGDYTLSRLDASSLGCSIFVAAILAIWNGASTKGQES